MRHGYINLLSGNFEYKKLNYKFTTSRLNKNWSPFVIRNVYKYIYN